MRVWGASFASRTTPLVRNFMEGKMIAWYWVVGIVVVAIIATVWILLKLLFPKGVNISW